MANKSITLNLKAPRMFNFRRTVYNHGWCVLPPFRVDRQNHHLFRLLTLEDGTAVHCELLDGGRSTIVIRASSAGPLSAAHRAGVLRKISECLRLTENFSDFFREANRYPKYRWIVKAKTGRMLRAPSVFEDLVKMICTTNCSWALTEIMTGNLVGELGIPFDGTAKSFPTPEAIAGSTERFMRKTIRAGYRSPYLIEFADRVASGKLDVEQWRTSNLPTPALFRELRSVKGAGDYTAGNMLKLLGRYDYLGLDSWVRGQYYELYHHGRAVSDRTIEKRYDRYGKWRGLFFWLEMTKHWFERNPPF